MNSKYPRCKSWVTHFYGYKKDSLFPISLYVGAKGFEVLPSRLKSGCSILFDSLKLLDCKIKL